MTHHVTRADLAAEAYQTAVAAIAATEAADIEWNIAALEQATVTIIAAAVADAAIAAHDAVEDSRAEACDVVLRRLHRRYLRKPLV